MTLSRSALCSLNRNLVHAVTDSVFDAVSVQIGLLVANDTHGGRSVGWPRI